jgi:nucleoside-diphosphate-sugar epimerase
MFQWALRTKPDHVVYYSSSAAYPIDLQGYGSEHKLVEDDIDLDNVRLPDLTYGWAKLTGEILAKYAEQEGLRVHVFRPFSGYGEDQDLTYPFPSFIHRGVHRYNPFSIWGTGKQVRDFIHIEDDCCRLFRFHGRPSTNCIVNLSPIRCHVASHGCLHRGLGEHSR